MLRLSRHGCLRAQIAQWPSPLFLCCQGYAECFDTIALLLRRGYLPLPSAVLSSWQSKQLGNPGKTFFLSRVSSS